MTIDASLQDQWFHEFLAASEKFRDAKGWSREQAILWAHSMCLIADEHIPESDEYDEE